MNMVPTYDWLADLAALIDKAELEGKWLHCNYQDLWFSPAKLRAANARGDFKWGVVNWTLRDPAEKLSQLRQAAREATDAVTKFERKMANQ